MFGADWENGNALQPIIRALRVRQWVKNVLLFVPLLTAHELTDVPKLICATLGLIAFSLCASAVYVVNDLLDVEVDRNHPEKKLRPFASGELSTTQGLVMAMACVAAGVAFSLVLPWAFVVVLACYLLLSTAYSVTLKRTVILDVVTLAVLHIFRLLAGGAATEIVVSEWLIAFALFIFVSLAVAKRYAELARLQAEDSGERAAGRGYWVNDLRLLEAMGPCCGFLAVLVLALYINSDSVKELYARPRVLWLLCPLLTWWVGRLWILVGRGTLPEDPLAFALTDRSSMLGAVVAVLTMAVATYD